MKALYHNHIESILQIDIFKSIEIGCDIQCLITLLNIILVEAMVKNKDRDFSQQENIIKALERIKAYHYEIENNQNFLIKEMMKVNNQSREVQGLCRQKDYIIEKLKKEVETLKSNLP